MNLRLKHTLIVFLTLLFITACGDSSKKMIDKNSSEPAFKKILIKSNPAGAKVLLDNKIVCYSTPCEIVIPLTYNKFTSNTIAPSEQAELSSELNTLSFTFVKDGFEPQKVEYKPTVKWIGGDNSNQIFYYPDFLLHNFIPERDSKDPSIPYGETHNMVTRDNPGYTALEKTIIRWAFDSEPRGARIYWRVVSSIPHIVKNTNETYMTTTPLEETRAFNIQGLTYANSRDVQIEIKVTKAGYYDQIKRYNVRQAIDQQEISGFFELVPKSEN